MLKQLLKTELKAILIDLKDWPINLFLLLLALIKALLTDTQTQLLGIMSLLIGIFASYQLGLIVFFASYSLCFFIIANLKNILGSRHPRSHNE